MFEYKVEVFNGDLYPANYRSLERILNENGRDNWELVNIIPQISSSSTSGDDLTCVDSVSVGYNIIVFKRERD